MANGMYAKGREGFATALVDWVNDTIKCVLIDTADYTVDLAAHDFLNDVAAGARVGTPQTLGTKSATDGILDAADAVFPSVTGDQSEAIIIWKDTGTESTSRLLFYIDTVSSGLPVTPNGGNITVQWDNGANKIARI